MITLYLLRDADCVPRMRDRDIDADTEAMIREYQPGLLQTPGALDIDMFVENYLGLFVHFEYLSNSGFIWGCMVFDNVLIPVYDPIRDKAIDCPIDANTIVVDNNRLHDSEVHTCRSTIAHESGHWVYHQPIYKLMVKNGHILNRAKGWERLKTDAFVYWCCTACKKCHYIDEPRDAFFCPACGARMDEAPKPPHIGVCFPLN